MLSLVTCAPVASGGVVTRPRLTRGSGRIAAADWFGTLCGEVLPVRALVKAADSCGNDCCLCEYKANVNQVYIWWQLHGPIANRLSGTVVAALQRCSTGCPTGAAALLAAPLPLLRWLLRCLPPLHQLLC